MRKKVPTDGADSSSSERGRRFAAIDLLNKKSICFLIFLYPIVLLWVRSGTNVCFAILLIAVLYQIAIQKTFLFGREFDAADRLFSAAMISLAIATIVSQAYHYRFALGPYDGVLRFLYVLPVYFFLRSADFSQISILQYGLPIGALSSPLVAWLLPGNPDHWGSDRASTYFLSPIHYGGLALILGFLSLFSINWIGRDRLGYILLKLGGFLGGLFTSLVSGSRGGWVAIPILGFLWFYTHWRGRIFLSVISTLLGVGLIAALASWSPLVRGRMSAVANDVTTYHQGNVDTSTGERVQIWWAAAALTLRESPFVGLGPDEFARRSASLEDEGLISKSAASMGAAELHSELISRFVSLGFVGLASLLAIYLVPLVYFVLAAGSQSQFRRGSGRLGLCLVVGFFVFGLTVETFNLKMIATFYAMSVAIFLAGAIHHEPLTGDERK